jgi:hypothetical protein
LSSIPHLSNQDPHTFAVTPSFHRSVCHLPQITASFSTKQLLPHARFLPSPKTAAFLAQGLRKLVHKMVSPSKRRSRGSFASAHRYLDDKEFTHSFRMPCQAYHSLLATLQVDPLRDSFQAARSRGGVIEPAVRLGTTLRVLSQSSYLDLMMLFRIGRSTDFDIFHSTTDAVNRNLVMSDIPLGEETKLSSLSSGFSTSRACLSPPFGYVGALDGISMEIAKPRDRYIP